MTAYELARHLYGKPGTWKVYMPGGQEVATVQLSRLMPDGSIVGLEDHGEATGEICVTLHPAPRP